MVLDLLKERSDDAYYTEEHAVFLVSKMRAALLEKKYKGARNTAFNPLSTENMQTLCLSLETADGICGCDGYWLKSTVTVPHLIADTQATVHTVNDLLHSHVTFVPQERMPYVGYNRWLRDITYCARSNDGHLYLHGANPQFMYLEKVKFSGVFSSPEEAAKLSCLLDGTECQDILDQRFPLEEPLVAQCVELAVQELSGARYAPEDKKNDAKDNLAEAGAVKPVAQTNAESK